jgi:UDP-N-acetylmuramyl pentapeptide phosphotransferase/UDP-N-acetylglucosamine-1-phosphate transferase
MIYETLNPLLLAFVTACVLGLSFTPLAMRLGRHLGLMDIPGGRRQHLNPTPRSGGLAVFGAYHLSILILCLLGITCNILPAFHQWSLQVFWVSLLVVVFGLIDDRFEVSPLLKLFGQILVAAAAWSFGLRLESLIGFQLHILVDFFATLLLFLAGMNAYNLIDGMDGLASGLATVTAVGLGSLNILMGNPEIATACFVLAGACVGFLRYNFHPARVFLGDTGSMFIGFLLIALTLGSTGRSAATVMLIVPLLTLGVPLIDTALAIWRRTLRKSYIPGTRISQGDQDHLHHRLARSGLTQRRVAIMLYSIQASVFIIGMVILFGQNHRIAILTITFFISSYVLIRYLAGLEISDSGRLIVDGIRRPGYRKLFASLMPFMDVGILLLGFYAVHAIGAGLFLRLSLGRLIREVAPLVVAGPVILFWAANFYQPMWTKARAADYFYFNLIAAVSVVIGISMSTLPTHHTLQETLAFNMVYSLLVLPLIVGLRIFPRLVQDLLHFHLRQSKRHGHTFQKRVLIYGAGFGYTLLNRAESYDDSHHRKYYHLVGLIDDDPDLRNRKIHGHSVLGTFSELPRILETQAISEIVVTCKLTPDRRAALASLAETHQVRVRQNLFTETVLVQGADPGDSVKLPKPPL